MPLDTRFLNEVCRHRLWQINDEASDRWRCGAALGLLGAGVQTLTESSLNRPANALLAAVLVGIVLRRT
mgnify:CR=1 FL=1